MDWYWAIKTNSCFVRSPEESHQSSSTQSDFTARRRWSNSILQDKISSSRSSFTNQYCSDNLGTIIYLRALQRHSGSNLIDPTLQVNVLIGPGIFPHIYHVGSTFNLHSIISNGLVPGGQNLSRRQTVFFLPVDPIKEDHKDPEYIDYSAPRLARYLHSAWKRLVDIDLAIKEGLTFYQTRSNAIILQGTLPAHCILKVERLKTGERSCMKDNTCLLNHHRRSLWNTISIGLKEMIRVLQLNIHQLENSFNSLFGEALHSGSSRPTQFLKPIEDRTGQTRHPRDCW